MPTNFSPPSIGPDLTGARTVDQWVLPRWGTSPVIVGVEGGVPVELEIISFNGTHGWALLRSGDYVRLGTPAPGGLTIADMLADPRRHLPAAGGGGDE